MKTLKTAIILIAFLSLLSCKSQQNSTAKSAVPKIENYTKGELVIKVAPFGLDGNEITVGKVLKDGTIHFKWPEINVNTIKGSEYFMETIKRAVGMSFCNEKQMEQNNKTAKAVNTKTLFLYKNNQQVGALFPATKKEIEDNAGLNRSSSLALGNTITWYYSDSDAVFKANCTINKKWKNSYNFKEITTYDIQFKKGWNMVQHSLLEKEDWKSEKEHGSLPKIITKKTITNIPSNINWYLKYWGK